jgi:hypothetical protein
MHVMEVETLQCSLKLLTVKDTLTQVQLFGQIVKTVSLSYGNGV